MDQSWGALQVAPGVIRGTLNLRTHTVVVRVEYTTDSYKITYVSSENMRAEEKLDGTVVIHKNYNSWVNNLMREINRRLVP